MTTDERLVEVAPGIRLWAESTGDPDAPPFLLIMGANASGLAWPDALVARLAEHHRVIRYDHRDTGRSTRAFATRPYPITALAHDALAVLDGFGAERAHVAGMSLGGLLVQLLMLDAPERLLTATMFCTGPLQTPGEPELPGPSPEVMAMWQHLGEPRDREAEVAFNVAHWRLMSGGGPFEPEEFRALEERIRDHAGTDDPTVAHALADASNLERGAELAATTTPALVLEAPLDPVYPPPNAPALAARIPGAELVTIDGMGHALPSPLLPEIAGAILSRSMRGEPAPRP